MVSRLQQQFPAITTRRPRDFDDIENVFRAVVDAFEEFRRRVAAAVNANADIIDPDVSTGFQVPVESDATRGAAGTAGRIIFNTTDGQLNVDDGTNWTLPDGTTT